MTAPSACIERPRRLELQSNPDITQFLDGKYSNADSALLAAKMGLQMGHNLKYEGLCLVSKRVLAHKGFSQVVGSVSWQDRIFGAVVPLV